MSLIHEHNQAGTLSRLENKMTVLESLVQTPAIRYSLLHIYHVYLISNTLFTYAE